MQARSLVCVFVTLCSLFGFVCGLGASSTTGVSSSGGGVTFNLTFPEEAHPAESITHNLTITANVDLTLENFTIVIKALVSSSWQQVYKEQVLLQNMLQKQQQTIQMLSNISKVLHDTALAVIRKIG